MASPFTLTTVGRSEIPHPAERAILHITLSSTGPNKASASNDVFTAASHLERLLRELSPPENPDPAAKAAAPLAHWSKTGLAATSHVPYTYDVARARHEQPRQYTAKITFDVRFQHFGPMGAFGTRLAALPHAEVSHIEWVLTAGTQKGYQSRLRRAAASDALEKARDYCEVLGCSGVRPVELSEAASGGTALFGSVRGGGASHQMMQTAPGTGMGVPGAEGARDESPLEFTPKEVRMSMEVTVKFEAENGRAGDRS